MRRIPRILPVCVALAIAGVAINAQPPQPKPGPEHKRLEYFVGKWTSEGEMMASPMGPGGKMSSTDTCEWFEGRFAVICRSDGKSPMGTSKGIAVLSYSPEEKIYTYYGTDSSGMMAMTSIPRGTVSGDTWTYTDEGMMGGQKVKTRVTLKELSPTQYSFTMEMQGADGKWMPLMVAKNTKVK